MKEWTVRNLETGALQMTGFRCETAEQAVAEYVSMFPSWDKDELYDDESEWND